MAGRTPSFPTCASNVAGHININSPTAPRPRAVRVRRGFRGTWMVDLPCVSWHWPLKLGIGWRLREAMEPVERRGAKVHATSQLSTWLFFFFDKKQYKKFLFLGDSGQNLKLNNYFWRKNTFFLGVKPQKKFWGRKEIRVNSQGFVGNFRTEIFPIFVRYDSPWCTTINWMSSTASINDWSWFFGGEPFWKMIFGLTTWDSYQNPGKLLGFFGNEWTEARSSSERCKKTKLSFL